MTGKEFREARVAARLSMREAAKTLGVSLSTIYRWQMGEARIPADAAAHILTLAGDPSTLGARLTHEVAYAVGQFAALSELAMGRALRPQEFVVLLGDPGSGVGALANAIHAQGEAGWRKHYEPAITEALGEIAAFPPHFNSEAQGAFWLGYYACKRDQRTSGQTPTDTPDQEE